MMLATTTATHSTRSINRSFSALSHRRRRVYSPAQARSDSDFRPLRQYSTPATTSGSGVATDGASLEPPPAGGHLPTVANSRFLRVTRDNALRTPGLEWRDTGEGGASSIVTGRDTSKMNVYQAIRDAMRFVTLIYLAVGALIVVQHRVE